MVLLKEYLLLHHFSNEIEWIAYICHGRKVVVSNWVYDSRPPSLSYTKRDLHINKLYNFHSLKELTKGLYIMIIFGWFIAIIHSNNVSMNKWNLLFQLYINNLLIIINFLDIMEK